MSLRSKWGVGKARGCDEGSFSDFCSKLGEDLIVNAYASDGCLELWGNIPRSSGLIIHSTRGGAVLKSPRLAKTATQSYEQNERDIRYGAKINYGDSLTIAIGMKPSFGMRKLQRRKVGAASSAQVWRTFSSITHT
jgi:hypothetical protein